MRVVVRLLVAAPCLLYVGGVWCLLFAVVCCLFVVAMYMMFLECVCLVCVFLR